MKGWELELLDKQLGSYLGLAPFWLYGLEMLPGLTVPLPSLVNRPPSGRFVVRLRAQAPLSWEEAQ